jgi:LAS superfamily LD-carboxypeptidase LdcB
MNGWQTDTWLRPAATALAVASIVLLFVNAALTLRNESAQAVVNQRQQFINQSAQVSRVALVLVQTIAKTALTTKDDALMQLRERHGVRLQPNPPAEGAAPGSAK